MPEIKLTDVTLRDGLQMESKSISTDQKIALLQALLACQPARIELTSFVHPKWVPQLADSEVFCRAVESQGLFKDPDRWMAFVPNEKGLERLLQFPIGWAGAFVAASESFNQKNVNSSIDKTLEGLKAIIDAAHAKDRKVRVYLSTVFGCPYEGAVPLKNLEKIFASLKALKPDEIALSDTIGVAIPAQVETVLKLFKTYFPVGKTALHLHNTYGLAMANAERAYAEGIRLFDGSTGGIGGCPYAKGASGNVAAEELLYFFFRNGIQKNFPEGPLKQTCALLENTLGLTLHSRLSAIWKKGGEIYGIH